jgi:ELWxxDGT repeat protein
MKPNPIHLTLLFLLTSTPTPTPAQTQPRLLLDIAPSTRWSDPRDFTEFDGRTYFNAGVSGNGLNRRVYSTDGTPAGTQLFFSVPLNYNAGYELTRAGELLYFRAETPANGAELFATDGTVAGTRLVKDIVPGASGSNPTGLVAFGDRLVFKTSPPAGNPRLMVTDGTAAGTIDLAEVTNSAAFLPLAVLDGFLLFEGNDPVNGAELWRTDGTVAGTTLIKDIRPGTSDSGLARPAVYFNGIAQRCFFAANDGTNGEELWVSDGTAAGTFLFADMVPGPGGARPYGFTVAARVLFFLTGGGGGSGGALYYTDGFVVRQVFANPTFTVDFAGPMLGLDDMLLFAGMNPTTGIELWRSDGSPTGTIMIKDIRPGTGNGTRAQRMFRIGSRVYFVADDPAYGLEVWRTDGTASGTQLVVDAEPGPGGSRIGFNVAAGAAWGQLVFDAIVSRDGVGQEPYGAHAGAIAQPIGWGCGSATRRSSVTMTDPVLGGVMWIDGDGADPGSFGAVFLGISRAASLPLGAGCRAWVDLSLHVTLTPFQVTVPTWKQNLAIPLDPSFTGVTLTAQAFFGGTRSPLGYEGSNGVRLTFGM